MDVRRVLRDSYPVLLRETGTSIPIQRSGGQEWRSALERTMQEELQNLLNGTRIDPLVELVELAYAYAQLEGMTEEQFRETCRERRERFGAFNARYTIEAVIEEPEYFSFDNNKEAPDAESLLHQSHPQRYPQEHHGVIPIAERPSKIPHQFSPYEVKTATVLEVRSSEHVL